MIYSLIAFFIACLLVIIILVIAMLIDYLFKTKIFNVTRTLSKHHQSPLFLLFFLGILLLIAVIIKKSQTFIILLNEISPLQSGMGQFGDFFNGILTPFLTIITIVFLYKAFKEQFKANELFYSFEIEKSFKEDIDWLRSNNTDIIKLEETFNKFNSDDEIEKYLQANNTILLRKSIYFISMFKKLYNKLTLRVNDIKFNNLENLNNLRQDVIEILMIYYMPSFKQIYRELNNYINNKTELSGRELQGLDIEYLKSFSDFILLIKEHDENFIMFKSQITLFQKKIKKLEDGNN